MEHMLDLTYRGKQIVCNKSSAFDVELKATREALGYERGEQLLVGGESRVADFTIMGEGTSTHDSFLQVEASQPGIW